MDSDPLRIGLLSISDRASRGIYEDAGIPALRAWLANALATPWEGIERLVADDRQSIRKELVELADDEGCGLILTTGGTGPAPRDLTPEATLDAAEREIPGFGERMRAVSLQYVPTAILSRQIAAVRGRTLIVNLPGQPKAIKETLDGVFDAIPYCLDLIGAAFVDTDPEVVKAFRPKPKL